jgi:hypothetical protein
MEAKTQLKTETGIPVGDNPTNLTPGSRGSGLPSAWHLFIVPTTKPDLASESLWSAFTDQVNQAGKNGAKYGRK